MPGKYRCKLDHIPHKLASLILPVKVLKTMSRKCIINILSAKCSTIFNNINWKSIFFLLKAQGVLKFPPHLSGRSPSSPTHREQADNSLTCGILTQTFFLFSGSFPSLSGAHSVCSLPSATSFSPELLLKHQPSYLWLLCFFALCYF